MSINSVHLADLDITHVSITPLSSTSDISITEIQTTPVPPPPPPPPEAPYAFRSVKIRERPVQEDQTNSAPIMMNFTELSEQIKEESARLIKQFRSWNKHWELGFWSFILVILFGDTLLFHSVPVSFCLSCWLLSFAMHSCRKVPDLVDHMAVAAVNFFINSSVLIYRLFLVTVRLWTQTGENGDSPSYTHMLELVFLASFVTVCPFGLIWISKILWENIKTTRLGSNHTKTMVSLEHLISQALQKFGVGSNTSSRTPDTEEYTINVSMV